MYIALTFKIVCVCVCVCVSAVTPLDPRLISQVQATSTSVRVTWQQPPSSNFLEYYTVTYSSTRLIPNSQRRKRATGSSRNVTGVLFTFINVLPHSTVMVTVEAVYMGGLSVMLQPTLTFTSQQAGKGWNELTQHTLTNTHTNTHTNKHSHTHTHIHTHALTYNIIMYTTIVCKLIFVKC